MSLITENSPLLEAPERNCTYGHGDLEKLEHREEYKNAEDKPLLGEDTAEDDSAPDGGWGWLVTLAGFVIWLLNGSCSAVFGVLFSGFLLDLGVSSSTTAWIQNLTFVLSNFCCYLMDPLVEEFGWRRVGLAMGVMNGCGLALSAFANSAHYLFFSYTVMAVFAWSDTLIQKMSALGTFGVGHGFFFTSYNLVMVEVLGLPLLQPMLSVTGLFKSSSFLIFGPLIGLVRDLSGSFPVCLTLLGVIDFFSIALWILIPFARRYDLRREQPDE
ncbi:monocarboxylate transporter 11-like [Portunus trituberculatus]|uniref:monocarboxylate transporter 11-like n=1 Tax=Portunus trituberculatus TaxID=210409 RepID=UPI001E1CB157|nr:monocarboxylate transporter 11-like [Portunus trituberculatus]